MNGLLPAIKDNKLVLGWAAMCLYFAWLTWQPFHNQGLDFSLYYSIGDLFPAGQGKDMFMSGEQGPYYGYSPLAAPFFSILQWLPLKHSFDLFFALKIFVLCLWPFLLACCSAKSSSSNSKYVFGCLAILIILPAIYEETIVGNINTFLLTLMFSAFALTRFGYVTTGAAIVTFVASFKPQYSLFFIPSLFVAPKKAILGGFISTVLLFALSLSIFGYPTVDALMHKWLEIISAPLALPSDANNMSTAGVIVRMLTPQTLSMSGSLQNINWLSIPETQSMLIARAVTTGFVLGIIFALTKRWRAKPEDRLLDLYAGITLITLFATPVIWLTHYTFLVLPVFATLNRQFQNYKWTTVMFVGFAAVAYFLAGQMPVVSPTTTIFARAYGLPFYALIGMTVFFIVTKHEDHYAA